MAKMMKFLLGFSVFIIALFILILIAAKTLSLSGHSHKINDFLHHYQIGIALWRVTLMGLFIGFYPRLIHFLYRHSDKSEKVLKTLSRRRYAVILCLIYELMIVQNIIGHLVKWIF